MIRGKEGRKKRNKRKVTNYKKSDFVCPKCGFVIPLPRVRRQREKGHIKDLYCPRCKKIIKTVEVRASDFGKTLAGDVIDNKVVSIYNMAKQPPKKKKPEKKIMPPKKAASPLPVKEKNMPRKRTVYVKPFDRNDKYLEMLFGRKEK